VITASRPVNKNVSTGADIRAKRRTKPGDHKLVANYQTVVASLGLRAAGTEESDCSLSFMNTLTKSTQV